MTAEIDRRANSAVIDRRYRQEQIKKVDGRRRILR
jgi:hypothetical protein